MNPDDMNPFLFAIDHDLDKPMLSQRILIHGDLVSFGKVRIKIILSGKKTIRCNSAGSGQPQFDSKLHSLSIDHGERTGLTGADRTGLCIGLFPKGCGTPTKYF
jgi:hypothetical protein